MEQNADPGPVDKSILAEQELHKSEAIFIGRGYKPVRFIEHGTRLNQWEVRHEGMLAILHRAGFYYLSRLKRVQLDHALLNALVERWRRETQTFHLRFGEMTVLLKDVAILTGLCVHGAAVTGPADCRWEQLCLELLGQEPPQIKGGSISIAWLYDTFHMLPEGAQQADIDYATRAYILYQIGCSLFPDPSGTRVHLRYLALLRDFDASGQMAWGAAVLAHLYRELGKASMKGKANCCAFLSLLQIWAWEHIQIGRPERLENKAPPNDKPLGCRWNVPFKSRENVRSIDHEFYRHGIDTVADSQITWDPYTPDLIARLPALCTAGAVVWQSKTPLICFQIVEMHVPDRVLLQFGMIQHIPDPVEAVERVTMQGKAEEDWSIYHDKYIKQWENRLSSIVEQQDTSYPDPTHARNNYLEWYWRITRRWISTPVERPVISHHLLGHSERALVDLVTTVQGRIRRLLSVEVERKRLKETLAEIDAYITTEMEKAMHFALASSTSDLSDPDHKQQHSILPATSVQLIPPTAVSYGGRIASATFTSNSMGPAQATVAKVEHVSDDYVEGTTILQLDRMRRIEPAVDMQDAPHISGVQDGGDDQMEDAHLQEETLDVSIMEVNLPEIINTPTEDAAMEIMNTPAKDAAMEIMNTPAKDAAMEIINTPTKHAAMEIIDTSMDDVTMKETCTADVKNDEAHQSTISNALLENVEVKETVEPMEGEKVQENVIAELQRSVDVPSDNGQLQENIKASMEDNKVQEIIDWRTKNNTSQGTMNEPLEGDRFHQISDASAENNSGKETDVAPVANSEMQETVNAPAEGNKVPKTAGIHTADEIMQGNISPVVVNSELRHTVAIDVPMEKFNLPEAVDVQMKDENMEHAVVQKSVDARMENSHITGVEETADVPLEDAKVQEIISPFIREEPGAVTEEPTTQGSVDSQDQMRLSKWRKTAIPTQENAEVQATNEAPTEAEANGRIQDPITRRGNSHGGQLKGFIRRKRKRPQI